MGFNTRHTSNTAEALAWACKYPEMIVVATVTASWLARSDRRLTLRWLDTAESLRQVGDVRFFAALEAHPSHREVFTPLLDRLDGLNGEVWWYWLDDQEEQARTNLRTIRVTTGRNLIIEYALRTRPTHVLFLDADLIPPPDAIDKMLDVDWPIVSGRVPAYCLDGTGPRVLHRPDGSRYGYHVEERWNTAGFLLVRTEVLQQVRWGHDPIAGLSDDPWFAEQVERAGFGKTRVRMDIIGDHEPLGVLEGRGLDRRLDR